MIKTIYGDMPENLLVKKTGVDVTDNEDVEWVEYWLNNELVHRSICIIVKKLPSLYAETSSIG